MSLPNASTVSDCENWPCLTIHTKQTHTRYYVHNPLLMQECGSQLLITWDVLSFGKHYNTESNREWERKRAGATEAAFTYIWITVSDDVLHAQHKAAPSATIFLKLLINMTGGGAANKYIQPSQCIHRTHSWVYCHDSLPQICLYVKYLVALKPRPLSTLHSALSSSLDSFQTCLTMHILGKWACVNTHSVFDWVVHDDVIFPNLQPRAKCDNITVPKWFGAFPCWQTSPTRWTKHEQQSECYHQ